MNSLRSGLPLSPALSRLLAGEGAGILLLALFLFSSPAFAQSVSLPLEGYYRPGQYMPLKITPAAGEVSVEGEGVMPVRVSGGRVAPLLVWDQRTALDLQISGAARTLTVRPLAPDEALVGRFERPFFTAPTLLGRKVVSVRLDATDFIRPDALAWDALDAIVFDTRPADDVARPLLACGVTLLANGDGQASSALPWKRYLSGYRIIAPSAGPAGGTADDAWYGPASAWTPGRSKTVRTLVALAGGVVALGVVGLSLLRRRYAAPAVVGFCLAAAVVLAAWPALAVTAASARARVRVQRTDLVRDDTFSYFLDPRAGPVSLTSAGLIYPLAASPAHRAALAPVLRLDDRVATLTLTLTKNSRAGVLERALGVDPREATLPAASLARARYASADTTITETDGVMIVRDR